MVAHFSAALPEITNQFLAAIELRARWLIAIEVTNQTNPERNVVQIVAVDVPAVDLAPPTIAHFDLTVTGGSAVADDEMVSEPILHPANVPVIIIERGRVPLTGAAVVHDDELPAAVRNRCTIDLIPN